MVDDLVNANDRDDPPSTVKTARNPYIKDKPSITYEEVQAINAAARRKSSNSTSSNGHIKTKRKRQQTKHQKSVQQEKCRITKEKTKAIREAAAAKEKKKAEEIVNAQKQPFFRQYTNNTKTNETNDTNESSNNNNIDTNASTTNNDTNNTTNVGFIGPLRTASDIDDKDGEDLEVDKDEDVVVDNPPLTTRTPYDIIANLEYDEEEEIGKNDSDDPPMEGNGVMQEYLISQSC